MLCEDDRRLNSLLLVSGKATEGALVKLGGLNATDRILIYAW